MPQPGCHTVAPDFPVCATACGRRSLPLCNDVPNFVIGRGSDPGDGPHRGQTPVMRRLKVAEIATGSGPPDEIMD